MKKIYTILNDEGFVIEARYFSEDETIPSNAISELLTENFVKAKFNFETRKFEEGATAEELLANRKSQVPIEITARQLRLALIMAGINLTMIDNAINSLPEPSKSIAQISWGYAATFQRDHELLVALSSQLSITEEQLDDIFITAKNL